MDLKIASSKPPLLISTSIAPVGEVLVFIIPFPC
jgi:hypothetical protein